MLFDGCEVWAFKAVVSIPI